MADVDLFPSGKALLHRGRPAGDNLRMADPRTPTGLSRAIEETLADAARDPGFRDELLADRKRAIGRRNYRLSDTEQSLLDAVPDAQLRSLIDTLSQQETLVTGAREETSIGGIRPVYQSAGIRPGSPVRGTRPGRVVLAAAAAAALAGGGYAAVKYVQSDDASEAPSAIDGGSGSDAGSGPGSGSGSE